MTDKEKIRELIEKRYEYWKEKEFNSHSTESEIRMSECQHLLLMIDSLQEGPVNVGTQIDYQNNAIKNLNSALNSMEHNGLLPKMMTAAESLGISEEEYAKIEDELFEEQEEPKFKVGQIIRKEGFNNGFTISEIRNGFYYSTVGDYFPVSAQNQWELVEEPTNEELETEIEWYMTNVYCGNTYIEDIARYFAKWQKEKDYKDGLENDDFLTFAYMDGMEEGKKGMREQMIKNSIEVKVKSDKDGLFTTETWDEMNGLLQKIGAKAGDKVYICIIKQEEELWRNKLCGYCI